MKRCFIGLKLENSTVESLKVQLQALKKLPTTAARKLRPVTPENLHVTVKFLGPVPDAQINDILTIMAKAVQIFTPVAINVQGYSSFGTLDKPRHIIALLDDKSDFIIKLGTYLDELLMPLGFAIEDKPRIAHITLARVQQAKVNGALTDWLYDAPRGRVGPVATAALILFESKNDRERRVYAPIGEVAF
ncbi:MAG: RNA 2',3'-cyclic phosphodiesterase [Deltaproteobacteria bacterium]|nr:RNA 2',3'-cyclic phosphodiesterase [Deltaproteobacteria bacterium]